MNRRERKPLWREYLETAIIALVCAILLRIFVVSAYRVNSASMADSLLEGDYIFVNKLAYDFGTDPQVGDIIVFRYPNNPSQDYIKRCVAVEGDTLLFRNKKLYVNGEPVVGYRAGGLPEVVTDGKGRGWEPGPGFDPAKLEGVL